jgi:hypothetical protein
MNRRGTLLRAAALASALSTVSTACSAPLLKLPSGPGTLADGRAAIDAATAACRQVSTISLEMSVSGSIAGVRVRGRLVAALTRAGPARLEAVAPFGQPVFTLTNGSGFVQPGATLLLPRDNRALEHGQFPAVLEAVTGIPLDASLLFRVVTGCDAWTPIPGAARAFGDEWLVMPAAGQKNDLYYLHREKAGPWRLVATAHSDADAGWRAENGNFQDGLPRNIRLVSARPGAFDVQLALSQVELNVPLGPEVFQVRIPASAQPISLDELKASGPLRANGR